MATVADMERRLLQRGVLRTPCAIAGHASRPHIDLYNTGDSFIDDGEGVIFQKDMFKHFSTHDSSHDGLDHKCGSVLAAHRHSNVDGEEVADRDSEPQNIQTPRTQRSAISVHFNTGSFSSLRPYNLSDAFSNVTSPQTCSMKDSVQTTCNTATYGTGQSSKKVADMTPHVDLTLESRHCHNSVETVCVPISPSRTSPVHQGRFASSMHKLQGTDSKDRSVSKDPYLTPKGSCPIRGLGAHPWVQARLQSAIQGTLQCPEQPCCPQEEHRDYTPLKQGLSSSRSCASNTIAHVPKSCESRTEVGSSVSLCFAQALVKLQAQALRMRVPVKQGCWV